MNTWKANLEETKKRYVNWWNHKGIVLNMWEHFQEGVTPHADIPAPPPPRDLNQNWFDPKWRAEYLDWYVAHSCLKADMLPVANTQLGPGSLAAILGGVFEGGEDTIWIHPDPNYTDKLTFNREHPNWLLHKELLKACKKKAQGHYYVGMPDLMEGLDVLAAMKGTDKVLLDTVMQPEVLEEQMQFINNVYFQVFDELYDIIREGDEMAFCYFSSWAPGKMTKLQSDISTMISVDDYRRFVQPFIREQCQKIDYTLYHLDGVGAIHHLPALLEVEELNAVQWTPGVGQPQGGDPKWYDLYKRILNAGKSIMACWVTLDELKPLLDNIGGDGVHLEMDFHNEDEVEQAMRIVEEFQRKEEPEQKVAEIIRLTEERFNNPEKNVADIIRRVEEQFSGTVNVQQPAQSPRYKSLVDMQKKPLRKKMLGKGIADTATAEDFIAVERPSLESQLQQRIMIFDGGMGTTIQSFHLENVKNNEYLSLERPEIITEIYRRFLAAGSDIISTNSFNGQRISLPVDVQDKVREINFASARMARQMADSFTLTNPDKPRYVFGAMGPTRETVSMEGAKVTYQELSEIYQEQAEALLEGGVDGLILDTIFDVMNAKAGVEGCMRAIETVGRDVPIMLSFTVRTPEGFNMIGQNIIDFVKTLDDLPVFAVGINCNPDIPMVTDLIRRMANETNYYIIAFPNAGLPDEHGNYPVTPDIYQKKMWPMFDQHLVNMVGGCCGTNHLHMGKLAELASPAPGCWITPHHPNSTHDIPVAVQKEDAPAKEEKPAVATSSGPSVFDSIVNGKSDDCAAATQQAIDSGMAPQEIINNEMIRAMAEVGQRFQDGKAFVPQLLMAGRAMKAGLEIIKPLMAGVSASSLGKVVIGTVKGDLHDIGKNLVASMLEGCGFEVVNIGIDVSAEKFIEEVKKNEPDILCMSALLTTTMGYMKVVIDALEEAGIRDKVKVMVGGAPVSQGYADEIGADGYSDNANSAVTVAKQLLGKL
ncbi:MAG: methyltransferase cognate corrinoid protein [Prevotella sp.]|nr:methyltransferase cognate corrinoid protein [Prevotella sp.]